MYFAGSSNGGTLELIVDDGASSSVVWTRTGDQGNQWNTATVDLSAYTGASVTLRFRFTVGTNTAFRNDLALDAISISLPSSSGTPITSGTVYPGDIIGVELTSSGSSTTQSQANITLEDYSTIWSVTTG